MPAAAEIQSLKRLYSKICFNKYFNITATKKAYIDAFFVAVIYILSYRRSRSMVTNFTHLNAVQHKYE